MVELLVAVRPMEAEFPCSLPHCQSPCLLLQSGLPYMRGQRLPFAGPSPNLSGGHSASHGSWSAGSLMSCTSVNVCGGHVQLVNGLRASHTKHAYLHVLLHSSQLLGLVSQAGGKHGGQVDPLTDLNPQTVTVVLQSVPCLVKLTGEFLPFRLV